MKFNLTRALFAFTVLTVLFTNIRAQEKLTSFSGESGDEVIKIDTNGVNLTVRAADDKQKPVTINREDLHLTVNGIETPIDYFSNTHISRFTIFVDCSTSMRGFAFNRSVKFIERLMSESAGDINADIYCFNESISLIGHARRNNYREVIDRLSSVRPDGETALYKSVSEFLRSAEAAKGDFAFIVLTDGQDNKSSVDIRAEADRLLADTGVITYLVLLDKKLATGRPENLYSNGKAAAEAVRNFEKILQPVSFIAMSDRQLYSIAEKLAKDISYLVRLGFELPDNVAPQSFYRLQIIHRNSKLKLHFRHQLNLEPAQITDQRKSQSDVEYLQSLFDRFSAPESALGFFLAKKSKITPEDHSKVMKTVDINLANVERFDAAPEVTQNISQVLRDFDSTQVKIIFFKHSSPIIMSYAGTAIALSSGFLATADKPDALAGAIAHELAHEFFALTDSKARAAKNFPELKRIEMACDGIATAYLVNHKRPVEPFIRLLENLEAKADADGVKPLYHPSAGERIALVESLVKQWNSK